MTMGLAHNVQSLFTDLNHGRREREGGREREREKDREKDRDRDTHLQTHQHSPISIDKHSWARAILFNSSSLTVSTLQNAKHADSRSGKTGQTLSLALISSSFFSLVSSLFSSPLLFSSLLSLLSLSSLLSLLPSLFSPLSSLLLPSPPPLHQINKLLYSHFVASIQGPPTAPGSIFGAGSWMMGWTLPAGKPRVSTTHRVLQMAMLPVSNQPHPPPFTPSARRGAALCTSGPLHGEGQLRVLD